MACVCKDFHCGKPTDDPTELAAQLGPGPAEAQ